MARKHWFESLLLIVVAASPPAAAAQSADSWEPAGIVAGGARSAATTAVPDPQSSYSRFIDPVGGSTADDAVRYALQHNGELLAARQMIAEARGRLRQAGLRANPMVEASRTESLNTTDNDLMFGAELPLELGGRRRARVAVAERELELREAEVADFERRLRAQVKLRYAEAIAAARNLKFAEDLLALNRDSHRLIKTGVERGRKAPLEQNVALVELNRVEAMRLGLESRIETEILELKAAIGMLPTETLRLRGDFSTDKQPPGSDEALRQALSSRPDLMAARVAERVAQARLDQATIEGKVDASLFAGYERMNFGFGVRGFDESGALAPITGIFHNLRFGVRLSLPLRNGNQGSIDALRAALEGARNRRHFAEIVARNEVAAAYARFDRAQAAVAVYRDGVLAQATRNLDVIHQTYVLGQRSLIAYLEEQRRWVEIETAYTDVLKEYLTSLVEVERAAGSTPPSA